MLNTYYRLHGWDCETSWQTKKGLEEIGLNDVAALLDKKGRLKDGEKHRPLNDLGVQN
jgi:hypothetical protein